VDLLAGRSGSQLAAPARTVGAERVLLVLKTLAAHPDGVSLDSLARELDIPKSSLHRVLQVLRSASLAEQDERRRYRLSLELVRLAFEYYQGLDRREFVLPALRALVERFSETAHYAELNGAEVVYVAKVEPVGSSVRMSSVVGGRNPAHCTALGKALLAYALLDRSAIDRFLLDCGPLARRTEHTVVSASGLASELTSVRKRGFAVDDQESELGVNCIAFPVFFDSPVRPSGAISVAALAHRTPLVDLTAAAGEIQSLIEDRLGAVVQ
jgi:DNA-binding IclR family transcriptional regulator